MFSTVGEDAAPLNNCLIAQSLHAAVMRHTEHAERHIGPPHVRIECSPERVKVLRLDDQADRILLLFPAEPAPFHVRRFGSQDQFHERSLLFREAEREHMRKFIHFEMSCFFTLGLSFTNIFEPHLSHCRPTVFTPDLMGSPHFMHLYTTTPLPSSLSPFPSLRL